MSDTEDVPKPTIGSPSLIAFTYEKFLRYQELQQGIIVIDTSIDELCTSDWLKEIAYVARQKLPSLNLRICSPGGGSYYALALYDALQALQKQGCHIEAVVEGFAASAAAMIVLQGANIRRAQPNARFLLHEIRRWVFLAMEKTSELEDEIAEMKAVEAQILALLAKRCQKSLDDVKKLIERREVWMSAQEAKEWGLIDEIL